METRRIGISLGNIGALHDGLGEFALQIGQRLAARAPAWREQHGIAIDFHLRDRLVGLFGPDVGYLPVSRWHRVWHQQPERYALWHSLHQLNKNLPPRGGAVRLVTVHDLNHLHSGSAWLRWRLQRRVMNQLRRADELVAISRHTASDVKLHTGWQRDITVISNGARNFSSETRTPLPGWSAQTDRPFLFHLSRMSPSKNPQAILDMAAAWPEMTFVMSGPPSKEAKALRQQVNLANVQFHLGIDDAQKAWAYGACSGFLFPSLTEGFGLPPIEAMHFGKPVFLSRLTSLPEIGGEAAHYFDGFEPRAMQAVVQRGLALDSANPALAAAVKAHAARFNWDLAARDYAALYLRLLGLTPASPAPPSPGP